MNLLLSAAEASRLFCRCFVLRRAVFSPHLSNHHFLPILLLAKKYRKNSLSCLQPSCLYTGFLDRIPRQDPPISSDSLLQTLVFTSQPPQHSSFPSSPTAPLQHNSKSAHTHMVTVSHLLQVHCGILPRKGSCQCCLVWV